MIVAMMMLLTGSKLNQADCFELNLLDFIISPTYLSVPVNGFSGPRPDSKSFLLQ